MLVNRLVSTGVPASSSIHVCMFLTLVRTVLCIHHVMPPKRADPATLTDLSFYKTSLLDDSLFCNLVIILCLNFQV